jgi:DnaK suppressor protein
MSAADDEEVDVAHWRRRLIELQRELVERGDVELKPNREDPVAKADEDTQPLNEMEQVIASRRNKERAQQLQLIAQALTRLDAAPDEFGYCMDCEEPIALRRLELMPWVRRCTSCEQKRSGPHSSTRRRHLSDFLE